MSILSLMIRQRDACTDPDERDRLDAWILIERVGQEVAKASSLKDLVAAGYAASDPSVQYRAEVMAGIRE
jgi:hypothetical protein